MSELFRREVVHHATRRLEGTVVLATPLSVKTLGLLLAAVVLGAAVFAVSASYARKAAVTGILVPDQGMIRATSPAAGTLQSLMVREGDVVLGGTRIAVISLSAETSTGIVGEVVAKGLRSETVAARAKAESQLARLEVEREQASIRLSKSETELKHVRIQVELQEKRVELARQELERGESIAAKGFMARREVDARRSAALASEQELAGQRRDRKSVE